ncbi:hypothetical protein [Halobellus ruber]|uniref:Uncharacterized protein n=1 Tax=Halobellus ruber TaxID=2761102 RepID=A0A7J9SP20_9EURY|nr:hypothetical protein [Halobellus ruber]MBB6647977.1 hypothetical protein [Halobellus ruber]
MIDEPPTTEAIADTLGVDAETLRRCLHRAPRLTLAHLIAFVDLDDEEIDADTERELEAWLRGYAWRELVVEDSESGFLIDRGRPQHDNERLKLLRCPACGASFVPLWPDRLSDPLGRHLAADHDPADFPNRRCPSDVFYTRPPSDGGRDAEGTQTSNRLREEPNSRGPPFTGRDRLGTGVLGSSRNRFFARLRQRVCASPGSGAFTLSGATSSRRRASDTPK